MEQGGKDNEQTIECQVLSTAEVNHTMTRGKGIRDNSAQRKTQHLRQREANQKYDMNRSFQVAL